MEKHQGNERNFSYRNEREKAINISGEKILTNNPLDQEHYLCLLKL